MIPQPDPTDVPVDDTQDPPETTEAAGTSEVSETALINKFTSEIEVPTWLRHLFVNMVKDRDYVRRDCMLIEKQDTVAVNHILRNQHLTMAYLGTVDPQPLCQPAKRVGPSTSFPVELFGQTSEIHLSKQAANMRFAEKLEGAVQDASTNAYAVLKVTLQADYMKDPTGEARFGDQQEAVAEYLRLKAAEAAGEILEDSAEDQQLKDLEDTLRVFAAAKVEEQIKAVPQLVPGLVPAVNPNTGEPVIDPTTLQPQMVPGMVPDPQDPRELERLAIVGGKEFDILGLPVMPHAMTFACDQIMPEDFRWDWRVTRPEDLPNAEFMAHRCFMRVDEIARKYGASREELMGASALAIPTGTSTTPNDSSMDPAQRMAPEITSLNKEVAVWEIYHKPTLHRYVFMPGMKRFLHKEVFQACGRRFFPFFFIEFNRVTGQMVGPSDVMLVRQVQDEVNTLRTHDREGRRSSYPVLFVEPGLLSKEGRELYRNRYPHAVIETARAAEIAGAMKEAVATPYDPRLFDTSKAVGDMAEMFGLPRVVSGAPSGEDLASAIALAKEGMETGVGYRRVKLNRIITEIFQWMEEISLKVFSEDYIKKECGEGAVWPRLTTEELYTILRIEVQGGLSGKPRSKDMLDFWMNFSNIARNLNLPVNGVEVMKQLLDAGNIRTDVTRFLMPMPMPGVAPMQGMPGMPQPTAAPIAAPGGQGPQGGAPPMTSPQRGAPDDLSKIPNHPPTVPNSPKS